MRDIVEIMGDLENNGIVYNGFDACECADSFSVPFQRTLVLINPDTIRFQTRRENNPLEVANTWFMSKQFDLIVELYQYVKETRKSIPKKYAKHQKNLDDYFEFENGWR